MDANDPWCSAYLPNSKSILGLARIERAKPVVVQTFDVVVTAEELLLRHPRPRSHAQSAASASTSPNLGGPKLLSTRSDVYVEAWAVGD